MAEKLSALQTYEIIAERAKGASREAFLEAMALIPKGEVMEGDELQNTANGELQVGGDQSPTRGEANPER